MAKYFFFLFFFSVLFPFIFLTPSECFTINKCYNNNKTCFYSNGSYLFVNSLSKAREICEKNKLRLLEIRNPSNFSLIQNFSEETPDLNGYQLILNLQKEIRNWVWTSETKVSNKTMDMISNFTGVHGFLEVKYNLSVSFGIKEPDYAFYICEKNGSCTSQNYDFIDLGKSCLLTFRNFSSWNQANNLCSGMGGHLFTAEDFNVSKLELLPTGNYWIGLHRDFWFWNNNANDSLFLSNWVDGFPRNNLDSDFSCASFQLNRTNNEWRATRCNDSFYIICTNDLNPISRHFSIEVNSTYPPNSVTFSTSSFIFTGNKSRITMPWEERMISTKVFIGVVTTLAILLLIFFLFLLSICLFWIFNRKENSETYQTIGTNKQEKENGYAKISKKKNDEIEEEVETPVVTATENQFITLAPPPQVEQVVEKVEERNEVDEVVNQKEREISHGGLDSEVPGSSPREEQYDNMVSITSDESGKENRESSLSGVNKIEETINENISNPELPEGDILMGVKGDTSEENQSHKESLEKDDLSQRSIKSGLNGENLEGDFLNLQETVSVHSSN